MKRLIVLVLMVAVSLPAAIHAQATPLQPQSSSPLQSGASAVHQSDATPLQPAAPAPDDQKNSLNTHGANTSDGNSSNLVYVVTALIALALGIGALGIVFRLSRPQ